MTVLIKTIPGKEQRYPTVGDWYFDTENNLTITVTDMNHWKYEFLVALHELVEVMLCKDRDISQESVDVFDIQFEKDRQNGLHALHEEPGNHRDAPYRKEHFFAETIERLLAKELNVDWNVYEKTIIDL